VSHGVARQGEGVEHHNKLLTVMAGAPCTQEVMAGLGAVWRGSVWYGDVRSGKTRQGLSIQRIAPYGCYAVVIHQLRTGVAMRCMVRRGTAVHGKARVMGITLKCPLIIY
jgi:hypothetical protein